MLPFPLGSSPLGCHRVVYGRSDRPAATIPVADQWVTCEVLLKTEDPSGTWWARVAYVHPGTYEYVEELLPVDGLRRPGRTTGSPPRSPDR